MGDERARLAAIGDQCARYEAMGAAGEHGVYVRLADLRWLLGIAEATVAVERCCDITPHYWSGTLAVERLRDALAGHDEAAIG